MTAELWRTWDAFDIRRWFALPGERDDKYTRGVLGVVTGSDQYPGAAVLGVEAAVRTGLGMVRYIGGGRAQSFVLQRRPEVVTGEGRVQAWLMGSGMDRTSRGSEATDVLRRALAGGEPAVIDSGALDLVGEASGPAVMTPHFRELAFVLSAHGKGVDADQIAQDPAAWAIRAADLTGMTVLLKGHTTYVASQSGARIAVTAGTSWLATAGSGDVLGGILGALVATHVDRIRDDPEALASLAATAAALHGLAGIRASGGAPIAALDIAEALPATIAAVLAP